MAVNLYVDSSQKDMLILSTSSNGEVVAVVKRYAPNAIVQESCMVQKLSKAFTEYANNVRVSYDHGGKCCPLWIY